ncbi:hypothetical protein QKW35_13675 [Pontibacterium granulatum]|nr:hypothetical protein [Pontibacterium granulatum]MDI3325426.1 hypothetical protein [Pontibacterium granulatum]
MQNIPPKKTKKVCRFCMMMRFGLAFLVVVAIFVFNGLSNFFG